MSRKVQFRLVKTLVLLALAFGVVGLPSAEAGWPAPCSMYAGCEQCLCFEDTCVTEDPSCGGSADCCRAKWASCWQWCIWY